MNIFRSFSQHHRLDRQERPQTARNASGAAPPPPTSLWASIRGRPYDAVDPSTAEFSAHDTHDARPRTAVSTVTGGPATTSPAQKGALTRLGRSLTRRRPNAQEIRPDHYTRQNQTAPSSATLPVYPQDPFAPSGGEPASATVGPSKLSRFPSLRPLFKRKESVPATPVTPSHKESPVVGPNDEMNREWYLVDEIGSPSSRRGKYSNEPPPSSFSATLRKKGPRRTLSKRNPHSKPTTQPSSALASPLLSPAPQADSLHLDNQCPPSNSSMTGTWGRPRPSIARLSLTSPHSSDLHGNLSLPQSPGLNSSQTPQSILDRYSVILGSTETLDREDRASPPLNIQAKRVNSVSMLKPVLTSGAVPVSAIDALPPVNPFDIVGTGCDIGDDDRSDGESLISTPITTSNSQNDKSVYFDTSQYEPPVDLASPPLPNFMPPSPMLHTGNRLCLTRDSLKQADLQARQNSHEGDEYLRRNKELVSPPISPQAQAQAHGFPKRSGSIRAAIKKVFNNASQLSSRVAPFRSVEVLSHVTPQREVAPPIPSRSERRLTMIEASTLSPLDDIVQRNPARPDRKDSLPPQVIIPADSAYGGDGLAHPTSSQTWRNGQRRPSQSGKEKERRRASPRTSKSPVMNPLKMSPIGGVNGHPNIAELVEARSPPGKHRRHSVQVSPMSRRSPSRTESSRSGGERSLRSPDRGHSSRRQQRTQLPHQHSPQAQQRSLSRSGRPVRNSHHEGQILVARPVQISRAATVTAKTVMVGRSGSVIANSEQQGLARFVSTTGTQQSGRRGTKTSQDAARAARERYYRKMGVVPDKLLAPLPPPPSASPDPSVASDGTMVMQAQRLQILTL